MNMLSCVLAIPSPMPEHLNIIPHLSCGKQLHAPSCKSHGYSALLYFTVSSPYQGHLQAFVLTYLCTTTWSHMCSHKHVCELFSNIQPHLGRRINLGSALTFLRSRVPSQQPLFHTSALVCLKTLNPVPGYTTSQWRTSLTFISSRISMVPLKSQQHIKGIPALVLGDERIPCAVHHL